LVEVVRFFVFSGGRGEEREGRGRGGFLVRSRREFIGVFSQFLRWDRGMWLRERRKERGVMTMGRGRKRRG